MATIMPATELLRRAAEYIFQEKKDSPQKSLNDLVDEAAMRFNLSPADSDALLRILREDKAISR